MNANKKSSGLRNSGTLGVIGMVTLTLKNVFSRREEAHDVLEQAHVPEYPVGLWENVDMWQRRSIR